MPFGPQGEKKEKKKGEKEEKGKIRERDRGILTKVKQFRVV